MIESQHGLRVQPDIFILINNLVLGSNPHVRNPEKLLEGGELHFRPTHGRASYYRVMFNSPGVMYGKDTRLPFVREAMALPILIIGSPECLFSVHIRMLYLYHI